MCIRDRLPQVRAPTLVLHCRNDNVVPFYEGRLFATTIPGARFVPLESRNHILIESEPAWERFITGVSKGDGRAYMRPYLLGSYLLVAAAAFFALLYLVKWLR